MRGVALLLCLWLPVGDVVAPVREVERFISVGQERGSP